MSTYSPVSSICLVAWAKRASSRSVGGIWKNPGRKASSDTSTSTATARAILALGVRRRHRHQLRVRLGDHRLRRHADFAVTGERQKLCLAGALQAINAVEGLADGLADREQAMVAQDHHLAIAEIVDQP